MRSPDPERSRAVLIGTSKYQHEKLPDLLEVGRTIDDLASALTDPDFGVFTRDRCEVLQDENSISRIGDKLVAAADQAEDLLLVYFAGHGLVAGRKHDLHLALPGSNPASPVFSSLEYDKVRSAVLDSPAATKVIILDCCFSGRAVTDTMADPGSAIVGQLEVRGSYVLVAAARDQVALILPGEEHTAFTGRLLTLLREGIPDGPEFLTIDDLHQALVGRMNSEGLPHPQKRATGTAELLPITRNRASAATALTSLQRRLKAAHATGASGEPAKAAAMLRDLLPEVERTYGADNDLTLLTRQYLALSLGEAGYRDQAVAMLRVLLPDRRRILGNDDRRTLRTVHILARNLAAMGETAEAIALYRELVEAREKILGEYHTHTARARRDLAALVERRHA